MSLQIGAPERFIALFIFFLCSAADESYGQYKYDIFPLTKNLQYNYRMERRSYFQDLFNNIALDRDSGSIQYIVRDSTFIGDTLLWQVEMRTHLFRYFHIVQDGSLYVDTTYLHSDTTYFALSELLSGDHQVSCPSYYWGVTLISITDTFPHPWWGLKVSRFSDDSIRTYGSFPYSVGDSIRCQHILGLTNRLYSKLILTNSSSENKMTVELLRQPITDHMMAERSGTSSFTLSQNYPNPFNPVTRIEYSLPSSGYVTLKVSDVLGREVKTLIDERQNAGRHTTTFDAAGLPSGLYFYTLRAGSLSTVKKMVVMK